MRQCVVGQPRAGIVDAQACPRTIDVRAYLDAARLVRQGGQCLHCVEQQIADDLLDLYAIGQHRGQGRVQLQRQRDAMTLGFATGEGDHVEHGAVQIQRLALAGFATRQRTHARDDGAGAAGVGEHAFQCGSGLGQVGRLLRQPALAGIATGHDGGQGLIDFVRDR